MEDQCSIPGRGNYGIFLLQLSHHLWGPSSVYRSDHSPTRNAIPRNVFMEWYLIKKDASISRGPYSCTGASLPLPLPLYLLCVSTYLTTVHEEW